MEITSRQAFQIQHTSDNKSKKKPQWCIDKEEIVCGKGLMHHANDATEGAVDGVTNIDSTRASDNSFKLIETG